MLPLEIYSVDIESDNPEQEVYEIPLTVTANPVNSSGEGTRPEIIHQRDYTIVYETNFDPAFGLEEELITGDSPGNSENEVNQSQRIEEERENTLTENNQSTVGEEERTEQDSINLTTYIMVALIVVLFGYIGVKTA